MKTRLSPFFITSLVALVFSSAAIASDMPPSSRESIEWCDIWISHASETNLPRVLLIGDSISRDYYRPAEKLLEGRAYTARLSTSRFISDPVLLQEIALVLDNNKFQVIHFNNGMHGWQHSEAEYQAAFPKLLATLKAHAPDARLIWAATTSLKESKPLPPGGHSQASDERIAERNKIALSLVQKKKIPVDDLHALCQGHPEYHSDNVHFNPTAIDLQGAQVAAEIEKLLKP
jgi:hypothetical protein